MSFDDRPPERGAYTPPTGDDDLPFNRNGFEPRRPAARRPLPLTLIVSAAVLLILLVAVVLFYRSGVRSAWEAPPVVGAPVGDITAPAPVDAQPLDPEAGLDVYSGAADATAEPQFTPPPEQPQPRPAPTTGEPLAPAAPATRAPAATAPVENTPAPSPAPARPAPAEKAEPASPPAATGGGAAVQIGAFSSRAIADREYAAVAAAFPQFASGRTKGVEQVTTSGGQTVYRTTFNGFTREQAREFCAALQAAGRDCLVR